MRILRGVLLGAALLGAGIGGVAIAVLIGRPTGAAAAPSPATLVGDASVEPTASAVRAGATRAWQYRASTSGSSATESLFVEGSTNAARHLILSLYSDVAGAPGVLLGSGTGTGRGPTHGTPSRSAACR